MEARRLERQRRDSAKSSAAETLPSTKDKEFHLRLIELYEKYPCLWNTSLSEYEDTELKRQAWQEISKKLGAHLSPSLVRSRISSMRYRFNVYKLQMIEYKMSPATSKQPEKLYYIDKFSFIDEANALAQATAEQEEGEQGTSKKNVNAKPSSLSIASIFKQRLQQQQNRDELPDVLQRLNQSDRKQERASESFEAKDNNLNELKIASVVKKRMQQGAVQKRNSGPRADPLTSIGRLLEESKPKPNNANLAAGTTFKSQLDANQDIDHMLRQRIHRLGMAEQGKDSPAESLDSLNDFRGSLVNIPSVVKKRMQQQFQTGALRPWEQEKTPPTTAKPEPVAATASPATTLLRAMPGDSVSQTKVNKQAQAPLPPPAQPKPKPIAHADQMSDEEEFYRLHWTLRQQQRSRRPGGMSTIRDLLPQKVPPLLLGLPNSSTQDDII